MMQDFSISQDLSYLHTYEGASRKLRARVIVTRLRCLVGDTHLKLFRSGLDTEFTITDWLSYYECIENYNSFTSLSVFSGTAIKTSFPNFAGKNFNDDELSALTSKSGHTAKLDPETAAFLELLDLVIDTRDTIISYVDQSSANTISELLK